MINESETQDKIHASRAERYAQDILEKVKKERRSRNYWHWLNLFLSPTGRTRHLPQEEVVFSPPLRPGTKLRASDRQYEVTMTGAWRRIEPWTIPSEPKASQIRISARRSKSKY